MRYRIRYVQHQQHHMTEIEAHSPQEAVMKFELLKGVSSQKGESRPQVTSVDAVDTVDVWM